MSEYEKQSAMFERPLFVDDIAQKLPERENNCDLVDSINALTQEVEELKSMLTPNIILTGKACIDEYYKILNGGKQ